MVQIGVFGGTFDPPHVGHLLLAADARDALDLDHLIFVPAAAQPLKIGTPAIASPLDRLEMVRLVVADDANYQVDDAEIARKGLSYTVDTLEHLSTRHAGAKIFLLLGEDALAGFAWVAPPADAPSTVVLAWVPQGEKRVATQPPNGGQLVRGTTVSGELLER